jgi:hypothetical protein
MNALVSASSEPGADSVQPPAGAAGTGRLLWLARSCGPSPNGRLQLLLMGS